MTLSATQMAILTAAAQQSERLVLPPAKLAPAPRAAIRRSLLAKGLIEPVDLPDVAAGAAWAADGALVTYRITAAGLAAIRAAARCEAGVPPEAPTESPEGAQGAAGSPTWPKRRPSRRRALQSQPRPCLLRGRGASLQGLPGELASEAIEQVQRVPGRLPECRVVEDTPGRVPVAVFASDLARPAVEHRDRVAGAIHLRGPVQAAVS